MTWVDGIIQTDCGGFPYQMPRSYSYDVTLQSHTMREGPYYPLDLV